MAGGLTGLLDQARQDAGLSHGELWLRYFELGGMSSALQARPSSTAPSSRTTMTTTSSPMP